MQISCLSHNFSKNFSIKLIIEFIAEKRKKWEQNDQTNFLNFTSLIFSTILWLNSKTGFEKKFFVYPISRGILGKYIPKNSMVQKKIFVEKLGDV